jgi:CRP/FNR family transcriptional regulator, anaerobic regulatory protein
MLSIFHTYLEQITTLTHAEIERVSSLATPRVCRRNEFLLQEGNICRHKTFVATGLLRTFGTSEDGREHIIQFAPECVWTLDVESYDNQIPARFNIAAIERSEILQWTKNDFEILLAELPAFKAFSQKLISRNTHLNRRRLLTALGASPEEKYNEFVQTNPELLPRLPLRMIASYLGISVKALTRVRHAQVHAK